MRRHRLLVLTLLAVAVAAPSASAVPSNADRYSIKLGPEQPINLPGLKYVPDGHISYVKDDSGFKVWIAAMSNGYLLQGSTLDAITPYSAGGSQPSPVLTHGDADWDSHYAGFDSVVPVNGTLLGLFHAERHQNDQTPIPFQASIGLAVSTDGGITWVKQGRVLKGSRPLVNFTRTSGAGMPSALIVPGQPPYVYMYYTDWNGQPAGIHVARSPVSANGAIGTWQVYAGAGWGAPGDESASAIVMQAPTTAVNRPLYSSSVSVSYCKPLKEYVATFGTDIGFYSAVSTDGLAWHGYRLFFRFPVPRSQIQHGDLYYCYPTLISPSQPNNQTITRRGFLYYARKNWGHPHYMFRRTFVIQGN